MASLSLEQTLTAPYGTQYRCGMYVSTILADMDFETYSEAGYVWNESLGKWDSLPGYAATKRGLGAVGAKVYSEHSTFEILLLHYDLKDGRGARRWQPGQPNPQDLFDHVACGKLIEAHNSGFEFYAWERAVQLYGWPKPSELSFRCSMAKSRAWSLPGGLGPAAVVMGTQPKDKGGDALIRRFSIPQKPTAKHGKRIYPADDPLTFEQYASYNHDDIRAEAHLSANVPDLSPIELEHWQYDQRINRRGVHMDMETINGAIQILEQAQVKYGAEMTAITGGIKPSEVAQLLGWCNAFGAGLTSMDAESVDTALKNPELAPQVRRVLEIRSRVSSASVKKLYAMKHMTDSRGRLCDLFKFNAARTGRPTGADVQATNLPRAGPMVRRCMCGRWSAPKAEHCPWCLRKNKWVNKDAEVLPVGSKPDEWNPSAMKDAIHIVRNGNLAMLEWFFGDALLTLAGCLRGMFDAAPGHKLVSSDWTSIEAVVLACLAGEQWRIDLFENKGKIYEKSGALVVGVTYEEVIEYQKRTGMKHAARQIGKVCLGPHTLVLTDRGYVAIVDVLTTDKLWDGVEWVNHTGLIHQGVKPVINLDGALMTRDHRVNCGHSWKEAYQLASNKNTLALALATASAVLPWSASTLEQAGVCFPYASNARVDENPMMSMSTTCGGVKPRDAINVLCELPGQREKCIGSTPMRCPTMSTADDYSIGSLRQSLDATTLKTACSPTTGHGEFRFVRNGDLTNSLSSCTSNSYPGGTTHPSKWTVQTSTGITPPETCSSLVDGTTCSINERFPKCSERLTTCANKSMSCSDVYDITNAGPRRRFTIKTNNGHLIVHNCELALGYGGWVHAWLAFDDSGSRSEDEIKEIILKWRAASPAVVEFWGGQSRKRGAPYYDRVREYYGAEGTFIKAVLYPGQWFQLSSLMLHSPDGKTVYVRLPSGRFLTYHGVALTPSTRFGKDYDISYWGWNTNPKNGPVGKWINIMTHGGKLVENWTQATSNDILRHTIPLLERDNFPVVLHVYDELVSEVPDHAVHDGIVKRYEQHMATPAPWARLPDGTPWPVRADGGWIDDRYQKG